MLPYILLTSISSSLVGFWIAAVWQKRRTERQRNQLKKIKKDQEFILDLCLALPQEGGSFPEEFELPEREVFCDHLRLLHTLAGSKGIGYANIMYDTLRDCFNGESEWRKQQALQESLSGCCGVSKQLVRNLEEQGYHGLWIAEKSAILNETLKKHFN